MWGLSALSVRQRPCRHHLVPPPAAPGRFTQQLLFSTGAIGAPSLVGRLDVATPLLRDAQLIYRSRGGEILKRWFLGKRQGDGINWTVELLISTGHPRSTANQFVPPLIINLDDLNFEVELAPELVLPANAGLFAIVHDGPAADGPMAGRVDGVLELERDTLIS